MPKKVIASAALLLLVIVVILKCAAPSDRYLAAYAEQVDAGRSEEYARAYAEQVDVGKTEEYARAYAAQIDVGQSSTYASRYASISPNIHLNQIINEDKTPEYIFAYAGQIDRGQSEDYARAYAEQIDSGRSEEYARAYAGAYIHGGKSSTYAHAYAEQVAAGRSYKYAGAYVREIDSGNSSTYAHAYAEQVATGRLEEYAHAYAEQVDAGRSTKYARTHAERQVHSGELPRYARPVDFGGPMYRSYFLKAILVEGLSEQAAHEYAMNLHIGSNCTEAPNEDSEAAIDAAVVLAMYSTTNDTEADKRAASVRDITTYVGRGDLVNDTALDLLDDIVPEASITERERTASRLASISDDSGGELTPQQSMQVANELTRLVAGYGLDAELRTEAAREMVRLSKSGDLNANNASELMDTIAPEWSVAERKEALGYLAWQLAHGDWDADSTKRTAEEGYTLIMGSDIQLERRMEAGVEIVGEGLKRYGGDSYDDESITKATDLIKAAISGGLNTDTASNILDAGKSTTYANTKRDKTYYDRIYDRIYALTRKHGWTYPSYIISTHYPSERHARGLARNYAEAIAYDGRSPRYAYYYTTFYVSFQTRAFTRPVAQAKAEAGEEVYNRAYAERIRAGKSSTYAHEYAKRRDDWGRTIGDDDFEHSAHGYATQIEAGKSHLYAREYAELYSKQIRAGKSSTYAQAFVEQVLCEDKSQKYPHVYAEQIEAGKSSTYAHQYIGLYAEQILAGNSSGYAESYAELILAGKSSTYAGAYIYGGKSSRYAEAYAEQILAGNSSTYAEAYAARTAAGKSGIYAHAYAEQIGAGNGLKSAEVFYAQIAAGRPLLYAQAYAWVVELID